MSMTAFSDNESWGVIVCRGCRVRISAGALCCTFVVKDNIGEERAATYLYILPFKSMDSETVLCGKKILKKITFYPKLPLNFPQN